MVSRMIGQHERFHVSLLPATRSGRWSLGLTIISLLMLGVFYLLVAAGQRGGETLADNWLLTGPILAVGVAGVGGLATALYAIVRRREIALLLGIPILWGLVVVGFTLGEFVNPH
jgi:hypothetical protein